MQKNLDTRKENTVNDKYTKIKNKLITTNIKDLDFRVMCYLISRSKSSKCFPSLSTIATDLKKTKETIRNVIDRLVQNNLIQKENRVVGTGKKTSNMYIINEEYIAKKIKQEDEPVHERKELFDYNWLEDEED